MSKQLLFLVAGVAVLYFVTRKQDEPARREEFTPNRDLFAYDHNTGRMVLG